jgi:ABC-type sugar transport system substrate-binding protein
MSSEYYTNIINDLYKANPKVVQVQAINQNANYLFASKHNENIASALAAEFLYNCLKNSDRKNILLFTGDLKTTLHTSAAHAFKDSCETLGLNLLSTVDMADNEEYFQSILSKTLDFYGNQTDGIYITSGLSSVLCRYLEENGYDIPLVAFDTYEDIKYYMKKGVISATISQNVKNQMKTAFKMLVNHLITGTECPKTVYTDVQLVLRSNIHQFD